MRDLSDAQWEKIALFFVRPDPCGAREKYPKRRVVEACLYRLREGSRWRALPPGFPPDDTVHDHWQRWKKRGLWQEVVLNSRARGAHGFHGGKKVKGRSRQVAVNSQGTRLTVHVTAASASDSSQAGAVMAQAKANHPEPGELHRRPGLPPPSRAGRARPGLRTPSHGQGPEKKALP